jgi:hypothetical protein
LFIGSQNTQLYLQAGQPGRQVQFLGRTEIFHLSIASQLALGDIKLIEWVLEVLSLAR